MATAMYSPTGEYKQAKTPTEEKALRKKGYINGHEYFSKIAEAQAKEDEAE